jgi:hypothetical protein
MAKATSATNNSSAGKGESIASWFRNYYTVNKNQLKKRSNKPVYEEWLSEHPDHKEVPENVQQALANVKSGMRSRLRKWKSKKQAETAASGESTAVAVAAPKAPPKGVAAKLEALEVQIDDCLTVARQMDRDSMANVVSLLRAARNAIVHKLGG